MKNHLFFYFLLITLSLSLSLSSNSVTATSNTTNQAKSEATIIRFIDEENGVGKVSLTMTINQDFLRIDDNIASDDPAKSINEANIKKSFVLLDRKKHIIYSMSSDEQQIIKIQQQAVTIKSPIDLSVKVKVLPVDPSAPKIDGKSAQQYQIHVNKKLCTNLIAVDGLLPDAVQALKLFNQVLAGQQAQTLGYIPADLYEACDLARHTFYPQTHLSKGFPIMLQTLGENGQIKNSRILVDFKKDKVSPALFVLPNYDMVPIN